MYKFIRPTFSQPLFIFVELFQTGHRYIGEKQTRVSDGVGNIGIGGGGEYAAINYEAASTSVEIEVVTVTAAVDAAAAPEAGNSGSGDGSGDDVDVGSGEEDGSDN